jgi:hypothetical protein
VFPFLTQPLMGKMFFLNSIFMGRAYCTSHVKYSNCHK